MKSFSYRSMFPTVGVVALLAGCSGAETSANTGSATNAIAAASDSPKGAEVGERHGHRGGRHGGGPDFLVGAALHENLGLTAEQRATIEGLAQQGRPQHDDAARPAPDKAKLAELAAAIRAGNVDASKVAAAAPKDVEAKMAEHRAKSAETLATLHKTLTPQQRSALVDAVLAKKGERREGPDGKGGEGRGARPEMGGPGHGPGGHLLEGLDLTQAQKDQLKAKLEADRPAPPSEADRTAMKAAMDAKLQSFKADAFDAKAFVAPPADAPAMHKGGADFMAKELAAVVSVLTPEQREKLAQKIEQGPPARR